MDKYSDNNFPIMHPFFQKFLDLFVFACCALLLVLLFAAVSDFWTYLTGPATLPSMSAVIQVTDNQNCSFAVSTTYVELLGKSKSGIMKVPVILDWTCHAVSQRMNREGTLKSIDINLKYSAFYVAHRPTHLHLLARPAGAWDTGWISLNNGFGDNPTTRVVLPKGAMLYRWENEQPQLKIYITTEPTTADIGIAGPVSNYSGKDPNATEGGGVQIAILQSTKLKLRDPTHIEHFLII
jgi:hypothetical protein